MPLDMLNFLLFTLGLAGLLTGIILTPTPVPATSLLIAFSVGLLIHTSTKAEKSTQFLRTKFNIINKAFLFFEQTLGTKFKKVGETLKKTRPIKTEMTSDDC